MPGPTIIERLRKQDASDGAGFTAHEAAGDIERLMAALKGLLELGPNHCHTGPTFREVQAACSTCSRQIAARVAIAKVEC